MCIRDRIRATQDRRASTETLEYVHKNLSDWPRLTTVRSLAEKRMFDENWSSRKVMSWFGTEEPVSGEGRAKLAEAHYALGNTDLGDKYLKLAWRESRLTRDGQKKVFGKYRDKLTKEDNAARADHLIWLGYSHCLLYTSPSPRDKRQSRMPSSA